MVAFDRGPRRLVSGISPHLPPIVRRLLAYAIRHPRFSYCERAAPTSAATGRGPRRPRTLAPRSTVCPGRHMATPRTEQSPSLAGHPRVSRCGTRPRAARVGVGRAETRRRCRPDRDHHARVVRLDGERGRRPVVQQLEADVGPSGPPAAFPQFGQVGAERLEAAVAGAASWDRAGRPAGSRRDRPRLGHVAGAVFRLAGCLDDQVEHLFPLGLHLGSLGREPEERGTEAGPRGEDMKARETSIAIASQPALHRGLAEVEDCARLRRDRQEAGKADEADLGAPWRSCPGERGRHRARRGRPGPRAGDAADRPGEQAAADTTRRTPAHNATARHPTPAWRHGSPARRARA